jgi:hypothetical protein
MKKFLLIASMLFSLWTNATTFYISSSGNDNTGNGTLGNPWKTLAKAISTVTTSGDNIHVNAGTYLETVKCSLAPGVSLDGEGVTSIIKSTFNVSFQGALSLVSAEGTNGNQSISNLKFDGNNLSVALGIQIDGRSNVSVHDCTIIDFKEGGCTFSGTNGYSANPPSVFATGNSFYNNTVLNCSQYIGFGTGCLSFGGQDGLLIYDNTINQPNRTGSLVGWPIKYNNEGFNKNVKIYNNTITKTFFNNGANSGWNFSIELWNSLGGNEIYNNNINGAIDLAYNLRSPGLAYSYYIHDNFIHKDSLSSSDEQGIILERGIDGLIVENNKFYNLSSGIDIYVEWFGAPMDPLNYYHNIKIRKNIFYNIGKYGANGGGGIGFDTQPNSTVDLDTLIIDNNTIVGATTGFFTGNGIGLVLNNIPGTVNNVSIRNNIIQKFDSYGMRVQGSGVTFGKFVVQNNDFWQNAFFTGVNAPVFDNSPSNLTNSGNKNENPLFNTGNTYSLQSSSTLIDAGTDVGISFSGLSIDIGAVEFSSGGNISPSVNAGTDASITLPVNSYSLSATASDPDGTIASYLWEKVSGPSLTIQNPTSQNATAAGLVEGVYLLKVTVTDNLGATSVDNIQITVNAAPVLSLSVLSVSPTSVSCGLTISDIYIEMSKQISSVTSVKITKTSGTVSSSYRIVNNRIYITPLTTLSLDVPYKITFTGIKATDNSVLSTYSFQIIRSAKIYKY